MCINSENKDLHKIIQFVNVYKLIQEFGNCCIIYARCMNFCSCTFLISYLNNTMLNLCWYFTYCSWLKHFIFISQKMLRNFAQDSYDVKKKSPKMRNIRLWSRCSYICIIPLSNYCVSEIHWWRLSFDCTVAFPAISQTQWSEAVITI